MVGGFRCTQIATLGAAVATCSGLIGHRHKCATRASQHGAQRGPFGRRPSTQMPPPDKSCSENWRPFRNRCLEQAVGHNQFPGSSALRTQSWERSSRCLQRHRSIPARPQMMFDTRHNAAARRQRSRARERVLNRRPLQIWNPRAGTQVVNESKSDAGCRKLCVQALEDR